MRVKCSLCIGLSAFLSGCNSHAYHAEATQYHAVAQRVLISRGVCFDAHDCQKKSILFFAGGEVSLGSVRWGGAYITLYETRDIATVEEIASQFALLHAQLKEPKVVRTVYSSRHRESKVKFRELVIE